MTQLLRLRRRAVSHYRGAYLSSQPPAHLKMGHSGMPPGPICAPTAYSSIDPVKFRSFFPVRICEPRHPRCQQRRRATFCQDQILRSTECPAALISGAPLPNPPPPLHRPLLRSSRTLSLALPGDEYATTITVASPDPTITSGCPGITRPSRTSCRIRGLMSEPRGPAQPMNKADVGNAISCNYQLVLPPDKAGLRGAHVEDVENHARLLSWVGSLQHAVCDDVLLVRANIHESNLQERTSATSGHF
jgi:hypothetical protein